jgi:hypothetical protein
MLDFWDISIISLVVFIVLVFTIKILIRIRYVKTINNISAKVKEILPNGIIRLYERENVYQIQVDEQNLITLIKVILSREEYEFIITNSNKWTVNNNPLQWTRKSKPMFISDSDAFINIKKTDLPLRKIVLIYPSCKRVIRYLNESDTIMVREKDTVNGINFVQWIDLEKILKNQ